MTPVTLLSGCVRPLCSFSAAWTLPCEPPLRSLMTPQQSNVSQILSTERLKTNDVISDVDGSTPCAIIEMQIKTRRHHHTPRRTAQTQNTDSTKCCQGCGTSFHVSIVFNIILNSPQKQQSCKTSAVKRSGPSGWPLGSQCPPPPHRRQG